MLHFVVLTFGRLKDWKGLVSKKRMQRGYRIQLIQENGKSAQHEERKKRVGDDEDVLNKLRKMKGKENSFQAIDENPREHIYEPRLTHQPLDRARRHAVSRRRLWIKAARRFISPAQNHVERTYETAHAMGELMTAGERKVCVMDILRGALLKVERAVAG